MPDIFATIVTTVPNLAIAVWCLIQYQKTIDKLLASQQALLDKLMDLHPPQALSEVKGKID